MPVMNAVFMIIILFFLSMILFANNPFTTVAMIPPDGKGLNPLLQNIAMVVHPPSLYLGYTGFTVPFAFAIAALVTRRLDSVWIEDSRRWTLVAWFFLTLGNILGAAWAYVELGWGGFWAWDPVENAALMPWLTASAYIHSVQIQRKRGMLMVWNVSLICLTFLLTILGTYLTRSGVVQSVHAFSDSKLGPFFLFFMTAILMVSIYLIVSRRRELQSTNILQSYLSKESAFIFNNIILVIGALSVLWGTLFPTLSEAVTGERITVGAPFFNKMMAPIGLSLLLLMGIGPMISWKKANWRTIKWTLLGPFLFGIGMAGIFWLVGIRQWYMVSSILLIVFVAGTITLEFTRGIKVVKLQKKLGILPALADLVINNNRRYGGYLVHVGILMIFLAIAGTVFKEERDFSLAPGESFAFNDDRYFYREPQITEDAHKTKLVAVVDLFRGDKKIAELKPAKFFYHASEQPTTETDIFHAPFRDIYLIIGTLAPVNGRAEFRMTINPLISFLWVGGFVILLGSLIVILPRKKVFLLFGMICLLGTPTVADVEIDMTQRQKGIAEKLNCMCGDCVRTSLRTCTCSRAREERENISALMEQDKSDDDIINTYIAKYGLATLVEPPQKGFFNLVYWVPPFLLGGALLLGVVVVKKWSRK